MKVEVEKLTVWIDAKAKEQLDLWVEMAKGEISGLGLVEEIFNHNLQGFLITEIFLPYQNSSEAQTSIEPEGVAKLMLEAEKQGHDPAQLKFWFHSHGTMQVFWSGTDQATIQRFRPKDYFISTVVNKAGQMRSRVDFYQPLRLGLDEVPTEVLMPEFGQREVCKQLFDERVKEGVSFSDGQLFPYAPSDPSREEIINAYCKGELTWPEAENFLSEEGLLDPGLEGWPYD